MNPLKAFQSRSQSIWLDYLRPSFITGGELGRMIRKEGLSGLSSNPALLQKTVAGSSDYDDRLKRLLGVDARQSARILYEKLIVEDMRLAADALLAVYEEKEGKDGFVCLDLPSEPARDGRGTVEEARRMWKAVNRPNFMVKVPATSEALPAIEALTAEGINVNATLIFSLCRHEAVAIAYLRGLERCAAPQNVSSVASFGVSRLGRAVKGILEEKSTQETQDLSVRCAVASAKMAHSQLKAIFGGERWTQLRKKGAGVQRLVWTGTGVKNPAEPDLFYAEELVGPDTVSLLSPATFLALSEHGKVRTFLEEEMEQAGETLRRLASLGIDFEALGEKLQAEGIDALAASHRALLLSLEEKRGAVLQGVKEPLNLEAGPHRAAVEERLKLWREQGFGRRLWSRDPTLWFPGKTPEIADRLGWLVLPETMSENLEELIAFSSEVRAESISHVVLLGMGGSSLAPDVFQRIFGNAPGYPELIVLDSTHPAAVLSCEGRLDLCRTLFLVSSKSGTTLETLSLFRYFWQKANAATEKPGRHFVAITDSGTPLARLAEERGFRRVFHASPDVGGRYSAFSPFGLLPAALIGMDVARLLDRAGMAAENCAFCVPEERSSGFILAAALAEIGRSRDKLTLFASSSVAGFPDWLEQLIAESLGKDGRGILPVVGEPDLAPEEYGRDRFFVFLVLPDEESSRLGKRMAALQKAGHPGLRLEMKDRFDLGREIFLWEVAVASAGSALGIHPFDQPDVQLAKDFTRRAMEKERSEKNREEEAAETLSIDEPHAVEQAIRAWLAQARSGDYLSLQAFLAPTAEATEALQEVRLALLKRMRLATTMGYGPRFLHSTGQLHKGGRNNGLFLQVVDEPEPDLPIPETGYDFRTLIRAQSWGDYQALRERGRRVLRVNLKSDIKEGLQKLEELISRPG